MTAISITPSETDVFDAVAQFLSGILPSGSAIFQGSIQSNILTVTSIDQGTIQPGDTILGNLVHPGTFVTAFGADTTGGIGTYTISPGQDPVDIETMSTFVDVIQAQDNRVGEPKLEDFISMTLVRAPRLSTNLEEAVDVLFTAAIAATTMTVSAVAFGSLQIGATVFGANVAPNTKVRGIGAPGQYLVFPSQNVAGETMAAGQVELTETAETVIQLDVHGPNSTDFTNTICNIFRSDFAVDAFDGASDAISPLYCEDPRQMPFINAEKQYENRWVIVLSLQVDYSLSLPQQFFGSAVLTVTSTATIPLTI